MGLLYCVIEVSTTVLCLFLICFVKGKYLQFWPAESMFKYGLWFTINTYMFNGIFLPIFVVGYSVDNEHKSTA